MRLFVLKLFVFVIALPSLTFSEKSRREYYAFFSLNHSDFWAIKWFRGVKWENFEVHAEKRIQEGVFQSRIKPEEKASDG